MAHSTVGIVLDVLGVIVHVADSSPATSCTSELVIERKGARCDIAVGVGLDCRGDA